MEGNDGLLVLLVFGDEMVMLFFKELKSLEDIGDVSVSEDGRGGGVDLDFFHGAAGSRVELANCQDCVGLQAARVEGG